MRDFIAGANFSGRSAALMARLQERLSFFVGPYAEGALSGLSSTVADEIAANLEGSRAAASFYVTIICLRLFIIAFTIQATFLHFAGWTPLAFVRALTAPPIAKKLLVLTLSLIETILHAVDRARTALIAGGIVTRQFSWRNLRHGWILVQTVWLTVVVIAIGRTRDKWPIEGTLSRLDGALHAAAPRLAMADLAWGAAGLACLAAAIGWR